MYMADILRYTKIITCQLSFIYTKKEGNMQEIEFLIEQKGTVIPIEVKSKRGETYSLNEFLREWNPPYAYKLTATNIGQVGPKVTMPHYLAMFI